MRAFTILTLLALSTAPLHADDKATKEKLAERVSFDRKFHQVPFKEFTDYLGKNYGLKFEFDERAFQKAGIRPDAIEVDFPRLAGLQLQSMLQVALDRSSLDLSIKPDGTILLAPDRVKPLVNSLPAADKAMAAKLAKPTILKRAFDNIPLRDVLEYFSDAHEFEIYVDERSFPKPFQVKGKNIKVPMPTKDETVESMLNRIAKDLGGEIAVRDMLVIIHVPATKKASK